MIEASRFVSFKVERIYLCNLGIEYTHYVDDFYHIYHYYNAAIHWHILVYNYHAVVKEA